MIPVDRWKPADGLILEPNALIAVKTIDQNLALTAGPGAGKTEVLAQRADFLLRTATCRYPNRILAIAFKVDASLNLKDRVRLRCGHELASRFDSYTFHGFAKRIIDRFRTALTGADQLNADYSVGGRRVQGQSITFNDMVPLATTIVQTNSFARNAIRYSYGHVFFDEFQDCTGEQYQFVKACFEASAAKLTAVGDTRQRIMGWAGALDGIFEQYAVDFGALPLNLYQNFRSKPRLRRMQNAMVRKMDPAAAVDDAALPGDEGVIDFIHADDASHEAEQIAAAIKSRIDDDGVAPSDIAVLVSRDQLYFCQRLRLALQQSGIPFREEDGIHVFANEPIAKVITDLLLVAGTTASPDAHKRLLNTLVYNQAADEEQEYRARSRWTRFVAHVQTAIAEGAIANGDRDGLRKILDDLFEVVGRDAIVAMSSDYAQGSRLDELVQEAVDRLHELLKQEKNIGTALSAFSADRAVRIMSIHKSKGLEFDTVYVMGVEAETFWGNPADERSAFFVAISRAREQLVLTMASDRERPDDWPRYRWDRARTAHVEFLEYAAQYK
ncbi:ATP-dependent helicase [Mesorhizobium sp. M8A.F.Ca.ET.165.01.1.1]|uniref:UvrD-helicase domain-containing protein n=1 Tax=Mesorhizobium sp. M8A.F.Ca.ET.165.01.1.1 TaxID=2563960 RepID=UPI0010936720|nr:ATP-dependent helicase [Mesorhizobium sp. M8A.F.Ca.ET.165.01.1.1]TGT40244.1 ATP-dependent helicase [Mesorhizobium sp. M8A.F.Ca.ET.165.01.1.1]